jgi:hypothetical protein
MAYSTIDKPSKYFNTILWSGASNASGRSFTGVGFKPDWVWQKVRTTTYGQQVFDIIRGSGKRLVTANTSAEESNSQYGYLTTFDTDGFTTVAGSTDNTGWNEVGQTYVAWNWLASNTTVSNTAGSISSTVSANTTSGFSIVAYQGTSVAGTIGHGLGVAPKMIIIKRRTAFAEDWLVYHASLGATKNLKLNTTAGEATSSSPFNNTAPTSTVFSVSNDGTTNSSSSTYIAYCFADVKGYSKFGSYTGNGSTDGTFVYTGFTPAFVMTKRTDTTSAWWIYDNKRNPYNDPALYLNANTSNAEIGLTSVLDSCSNGFKMRNTYTDLNASGATYIYMAFASNPFVSSKGIPTTAR